MMLSGIKAFYASLLILVPVATTLESSPAFALPSFAIQTGQPCAACHVGAFGPQLKPYGRDFKLHGYVASDGQQHGLPLAWTEQFSFTHTAAPQPGGAAPGFRPNDNVAVDQTSVFYAGRIDSHTGAFVEFDFDGVTQQAQLGNLDIRHADEGQLFGKDMVWGITFNDAPTVQDPWNSTPVWGFPYNRSALAPTPLAATLADGGLSQRVAGAGAYMLWNDWLYSEVDVYKGFDAAVLNAIGQAPVDSGNQTTALIPYARLAVIKDWEKQHVEVGAYALTGNVVPGANQTFGLGTRVVDTALDGTYQFIFDPTKVTSDMVSIHATYIHEDSRIDLSDAQSQFNSPHHALDTMRLDASYSIAATVTPSVQYFRTAGTADPTYWATANGSPNSDGMIFEIAYVPFGKPDSPFPNFNVRLAAQYITYFSFNGMSANAHNNDNLYLSVWTAVKF